MNPLVAQALIATAGIVRGTLSTAFSYLNTLIKGGTNSVMQFHQEGIAFAREMGMNMKEAQAYTEVLTERTERLAMKYGVAAEQVKELQRNISVATSRQLILNESQAEGFLQLNKLVGSNTVSKFTEQIMNGMGGQLDTVQGAVAKAYTTAAKSGLNAQKVSEKIASNLNMANKLSFRTGIEGLTRMAMQAEKVGMNLSSIEGIADKFLEIDQAIENSARLQMLGGNAAIMGANPLDMAYEANYDPEALMDRVTKMARGAARFDAEKGIATVDPVMQDYLRNVAKTLGMSAEELVGSAKKQASNAYKESHINFGAYGSLTKEQQDFLINKSNVANGKVMFTTSSGQEVDLSKGEKGIDQELIKEMMKYEGKSDREIMEENARSLSSINEILTGIKDSITAMFGSFITGMFPEFQGDLKKFGEQAKAKLLPIAKEFGESAREIYKWIKDHKDVFKTIASGIATISEWLVKYWPLTLGVIIGKKLLGLGKSIGLGGKGGLGGAAARGTRGGGGGMSWSNATSQAKLKYGKGGTGTFKTGGGTASKWTIGNRAANFMTKNVKWLGRSVKGVAGIGTALSALEIGTSIYDAHSKRKEIEENRALSKAEKQKEKDKVTKEEYKNVGEASGALAGGIGGAKAGAIIGSMIAPGIGTVIGGLLGGIAGGIGGAWVGNKAGEAVAPSTSSSPNKTNFDDGGTVGGAKGKPYQVTVHGGEAVITPQQFNSVFGETPVKPKNSLGEAEYIYKPTRSETTNVNGNTVTVKDFNININGTLKLDGGNSSKNLDIRELLNDRNFINALKDVVKTAINNDVNGGRHMNDLAVMSGLPAQTAIYGR